MQPSSPQTHLAIYKGVNGTDMSPRAASWSTNWQGKVDGAVRLDGSMSEYQELLKGMAILWCALVQLAQHAVSHPGWVIDWRFSRGHHAGLLDDSMCDITG
ncbi:hypothetical protein WJX84_003975 [Apatococcus fuscideae]|uniref:Uncharacterized protein n=1 Tax=Apatococcus fuscideae TaxID=2026836 RepID=A0AAW1SPX8_9CHLO